MTYSRAIDANLARCSEGLRVIEDLFRFELSNETITKACKALRNQLKEYGESCGANRSRMSLINARSTGTDVRANDIVPKRKDIMDIITANIKRCTEACRVLEECSDWKNASRIRYALYDLEQEIWTNMMRRPLNGPGIYVISDNPEHLAHCAKEPFVPIVQYRNKTASKAAIYTVCQHLATELKTDALFIVNDHIDIAIAVAADGLHTGQDDLPISLIRAQFGQCKIIGRTTHNIEQGKAAEADGADYVSIGPIWDTPSKPNRPGIGMDYLAKNHELDIPCVAIGGINLTNIHEVAQHQPPLIGAIRATQDLNTLWQAANKK